MMLGWLSEQRKIAKLEAAGADLERAVDAALADPHARTPDIGGASTTDAFAAKVAAAIGTQ